MINLINSFNNIKKSNIVCLFKNRFDFEKYTFLNLGENIMSKIEHIFSENKNSFFKIFLGNDNFEEVYFFFYLEEKKDIDLFLGENISKLPDKITFEYQRDNVLLNHIILGKYEYGEYKSEKKELNLNIVCDDILKKDLDIRLNTLLNITDTRDLVNKPSCDKTPDKYLRHINSMYFKNVKVKVIDYDEIKKFGLNLIDAVGRASSSKPKIVILEKITIKSLPTYGFVGKGITFDTGGLNIKTGDYMYDMKSDMAGSATLLYMMKELDEKKLNINIVCALVIAENSISGDAYRPGDVIKSYSGKTVEIMNTDAEGRLVLADGVSYISKNYKLESITTFATLTGACIGALGYNYAGIMGNNKSLINDLINNSTFEKYWELPFNDFYIEKTKGNISDLKNLTTGIFVGSTMGGAFLSNFCLNGEKFAHIDIAGPSFVKEKFGLFNSGATGFGVDSLSKLLLEYGKIS